MAGPRRAGLIHTRTGLCQDCEREGVLHPWAYGCSLQVGEGKLTNVNLILWYATAFFHSRVNIHVVGHSTSVRALLL